MEIVNHSEDDSSTNGEEIPKSTLQTRRKMAKMTSEGKKSFYSQQHHRRQEIKKMKDIIADPNSTPQAKKEAEERLMRPKPNVKPCAHTTNPPIPNPTLPASPSPPPAASNIPLAQMSRPSPSSPPTTAEAGVQTTTTEAGVQTTMPPTTHVPPDPKSVTVTLSSARADCLPLGRKLLGVSATELVPPETGRRMVRLRDNIDAWVHTFKLQNTTQPNVRLKQVAQLVETKIAEGSLDGFRICHGLARNAGSAMNMSHSIESEFEDLLENPAVFSMAALAQLKVAQTKFLCMSITITSEFNMIDSLCRSWFHTIRAVHTELLLQDTWKKTDGIRLGASDIRRLGPGTGLQPGDTITLRHITNFLLKRMTLTPPQITAKVHFLEAILMPVCKDNHWVLVYANLEDRSISVLDSLELHYTQGRNDNWEASIHSSLIQNMRLLIRKLKETFDLERLQRIDLQDFKLYPHVKRYRYEDAVPMGNVQKTSHVTEKESPPQDPIVIDNQFETNPAEQPGEQSDMNVPDSQEDNSDGNPMNLSPSTSCPFFLEKHPIPSKTYGKGETLLDQFYADKYAEERTEMLYYPFVTRSEWQLGAFLVQCGLSRKKIDEFLKLEAISGIGLSFGTSGDLYSRVEILPKGPQWKGKPWPSDHPTKVPLSLFYRDPLECIQSLLISPLVKDHLSLDPFHLFKTAEKLTRVYTEWLSGDLAWDMKSNIPAGATLLGTVLSSDKTTISAMMGN
ncbi:hypothetical protein DXG01_010889 [Tephrocybe rancida]|nr:hypothetical protein DXG01_010889 [Tephrocybe rancida]